MNVVSLIGRFTRDPDLRYTQNGTAVANGNLAVTRNFKNSKGDYEADFIKVVSWKRTAELIAQHFKKGDMIGITGRIQTRSYEKDGRKVYVTEVVAENITFLQRRKKDKPSAEDIYGTNDSFASDGDTLDISDADLPF